MESIIFSLDGRDELLKNVIQEFYNVTRSNHLKGLLESGKVNVQTFSDGEVCADYTDSVRGKRVYVISSPTTSDKIMQLMMALDSAKRAGAKEIIPIIPYMPYSRSDKRDYTRGPIGAKVMAEMIENRGATSLITFDLHADQIQGFFNIPVTHMEGQFMFDKYIKSVYDSVGGNVVLVSPDAGGSKRVQRFKKRILSRYDINLPYVIIEKTRSKANEVDEMVLIGDVKDMNVIIIDDMADTAGTLCKAVEHLLSVGAKSVRTIVTHGVLSGPALNRIRESPMESFCCSDTIEIPKTFSDGKFGVYDTNEVVMVVSSARQIATAIVATDNDLSIEMLKNK